MNTENLIKELSFKGVRSSGAGGQHVNKVSSKIELSFNIQKSIILSKNEKDLLVKNLANRLSKKGVLILFCDESRSQHRNKEIAIKRFLKIIATGVIRPKKRKATKPNKASLKKQVENKRKHALKKSLRKRPSLEI